VPRTAVTSANGAPSRPAGRVQPCRFDLLPPCTPITARQRTRPPPRAASAGYPRHGPALASRHRPHRWAARSMRGKTGRSGPAWSLFLRSQAEAILACDFFTADLLDGTQAYVLAVIEHASRHIRILGVTLHPTGEWTAQQARNLIMDLGEQPHRVKFMIRDRGSDFTAAFGAVLADAGIRIVLCNVQPPRMNDHRTLDRGMPARAPGPYPRLEPDPSAADLARVRDPPQSAPAAPLPGLSHAAETPTRTGRSRPVPRPKADSHRLPDQRIPPGRMTWTRFSARTGLPGGSSCPRTASVIFAAARAVPGWSRSRLARSWLRTKGSRMARSNPGSVAGPAGG